ncbi:MAG: hypothetical protein LBP68_00705 [Acidobacteriota bacterium]|jgi:spoIIIJ-associated protein|nr:hypothetical protein [Acidobacteriota bacterium]
MALEEVVSFCGDLLKRLQMDLTAEGREQDGVIYINITGGDRGYLLSNTAALLNNVEYLLNKIFPGTREEAPGIELDSDDYRKHRRLELELLAKMASEKVLASGKPLILQPMVPRERRLVHLALAGVAGVESRSEGQGDDRSITISPT